MLRRLNKDNLLNAHGIFIELDNKNKASTPWVFKDDIPQRLTKLLKLNENIRIKNTFAAGNN